MDRFHLACVTVVFLGINGLILCPTIGSQGRVLIIEWDQLEGIIGHPKSNAKLHNFIMGRTFNPKNCQPRAG